MNCNLNPENKTNKTILIENLLAKDFISMDNVIEWFSEKVKLILLINDNNVTEKNISEYLIELQESYQEISALFSLFYKDIKSIINLTNKLSKDQIFQIESILVLFQNKILEKIRKINKLWEFPNEIAESFNNMKYLLSDLVIKNNGKI